MVDARDEPENAPGGAGHDDHGGEVWALTPTRRALHWALIVALLAVTVLVPVSVVHQRPDGAALIGAISSIGFAGCTLLFALHQMRAGIAVWLDPTDDTLTFYRAAGGALRTAPSRVQRIDRGRLDARYLSPTSGWPPLRVVTADATVTLSPLLHPADEITDALLTRNPHITTDL